MQQSFLSSKFVYFFLIFFLTIYSNSFAQTNTDHKTEKMTPVRIIPLKTEYKIKKGQELIFIFTDNPSVGKKTNYRIDNEEIIAHISTTSAKQEPTNISTTGNDAPTKTVLFKAINSGSCQLVIQKFVRSTLASEHHLSIEVE